MTKKKISNLPTHNCISHVTTLLQNFVTKRIKNVIDRLISYLKNTIVFKM